MMVELGYTKTPRFDYSLLETWSKLLDIVRVNTEIDVVLKTTVSSSHDDGVIKQVQNKVFKIDQENSNPISRFNLIIGLLSKNNLHPSRTPEVGGCVKTMKFYE